MGVETVLIDTWIAKTLINDPELQTLINGRVYVDIAPQVAIYPHIVFHNSFTHDVMGENGTRVLTTANYYITAYSETNSYADIAPIDARMDALLHRCGFPQGTAPGTIYVTIPNSTLTGYIQNCIRLEPFAQTITQRGNNYRRLGGKYYIEAKYGDS